jgi:DNA (cytosine-5)-methyltransferase 1
VRDLTLGSLCSGYGGLEQAIGELLGTRVIWQSEIDPDACKVLQARFPGVPNLGDLRRADWGQVPPAQLWCAGFPCQPVSGAGQRKGVADERWLFDDIAKAVEHVDARPELLVLENVSGLLSASKGEAFQRVIQALARLGYVGRYRSVRASSVGAPHRRERVFLIAWPASDPYVPARYQRRLAASRQAPGGGPWPDAGRRGGAPAADAYCSAERSGIVAGGDAVVAPAKGRPEPGGHLDGPYSAAANPGSERHGQQPGESSAQEAGAGAGDEPEVHCGARAVPDWRPATFCTYWPAIREWGGILARPAPFPTDVLPTGNRLSPRFVEWMMGLDDGWVTDLASCCQWHRRTPRSGCLPCSRGISRARLLGLLGNGVVPQQAMLALHVLLSEAALAGPGPVLSLAARRGLGKARRQEALYGYLFTELDAMLASLGLAEV